MISETFETCSCRVTSHEQYACLEPGGNVSSDCTTGSNGAGEMHGAGRMRLTRSACSDECFMVEQYLLLMSVYVLLQTALTLFPVLLQQFVANMNCVHCASWMIKNTLTDVYPLMVVSRCMSDFYHDEVPEV